MEASVAVSSKDFTTFEPRLKLGQIFNHSFGFIILMTFNQVTKIVPLLIDFIRSIAVSLDM